MLEIRNKGTVEGKKDSCNKGKLSWKTEKRPSENWLYQRLKRPIGLHHSIRP